MTWQVVIEATDRFVIGVGTESDYMFPPDTDFGPEYPILTIEDDEELVILLGDSDPSWISPDPPPYHVLRAEPVL